MKRKDLFRIALAIKSSEGEKYTATDFANEHDISRTVLYQVLRGETTSARLEKAIDRFIGEQVRHFKRSDPVAA